MVITNTLQNKVRTTLKIFIPFRHRIQKLQFSFPGWHWYQTEKASASDTRLPIQRQNFISLTSVGKYKSSRYQQVVFVLTKQLYRI